MSEPQVFPVPDYWKARARVNTEVYAAMRAQVNGFEWIPDELPRFRELWKSAA